MQKKLIALAVAGLMSGAAFAQTSVTVGGKFDAGYQFKRTANADVVTNGDSSEIAAAGNSGGRFKKYQRLFRDFVVQFLSMTNIVSADAPYFLRCEGRQKFYSVNGIAETDRNQ